MMTCLLATMIAGMALMTGCNSTQAAGGQKNCPFCPPEKAEAPRPAPRPAPQPAPAPVMGNTAAMAFPSAVKAGAGEKDCCAVVILEKTAPPEVAVGQQYDMTLKVHNRGNIQVRDVVVTDVLPDGYALSSSSPSASGSSGKVTWNLGTLNPGESKTITLTGAATGTGQLVNCATVDYVPYICVTTNVVKPALAIDKTMPAEVMICDPIPTTITVTNTGTGMARNVAITDALPEGLTTMDGSSNLNATVGDLAAGQSRTINASLKASRRGSFTNTATATADGGLKVSDSASVAVKEPVLAISKTGPSKIYVGGTATYTINVKNTGDGVARNTVVTDTLPTNATLVSASDNGAASGGSVSWNVGDLAPGASRDMTVVVRGSNIATIENCAQATATCAKGVQDCAQTVVAGIPAILLEVIDTDETDPSEVGQTVEYHVTVTNQGSLSGTNVQIVVELEDAQEHVRNEGATAGTVNGRKITFAPLPSLAPKARAQWRIWAKALKEGDVRIHVSMTEDRLTRPVVETEATNQYQ